MTFSFDLTPSRYDRAMMGREEEGQATLRPAGAHWLNDAARALDGVENRIHSAATDLFRDTAVRLSDLHRAQITQLLRGMITAVEDELRIRIGNALPDDAPPELIEGLGAAHLEIAMPLLERTELLREPELIAAMLRRVDEHRLALALGRDSPYHVADLSQRLLDIGDEAISEAVMALLVAESRRYDQFGDPAMARTDLPSGPHRRLLWAVAAAVRHYMIHQHDIAESRADLLLAGAVGALLAEHDDTDTLEGRAETLAELLWNRQMVNDALLLGALEEGWLALFTAGVARRAGIDAAGVWSMLVEPSGMMLGTVLRAIACERTMAVTMLWRVASAEGVPEDVVVQRADAFDALTIREAAEAVLIWRLDPNYRRAVIEIGEGGRQR